MAQPPTTGGAPMVRPEQIDGLPFLDSNAKIQYKDGLTNLWNVVNSSPQGSEQRESALEKIRTASARLMSQLANRNRPNSGAGQPGQIAQQGQNRPAQQGGQPQQMNAQQQGQQANQMNAQQIAAARARQQQQQSGQGEHIRIQQKQ